MIMSSRETDDAVSASWRFDGYEIALMRGLSPARARFERALDDAGLPLPLPYRSSWAALQPVPADHWLLAITDAAGRAAGAVGLQVAPSRALPGHLLLRCERLGPGVAPAARQAALEALVALARTNRRVLRLNVETFATDDAERETLERHVQALGFARVATAEARCYEHTLLMALDGDEEAVFATLSRSARRNVRSVDKNPVAVRPIEDPALFARLDDISRETYSRTGGTYYPADWASIVALSRRDPAGSRLVGIFRTDVDGPESLLAYGWGCGHGDHAHYSRSGSTRARDLKVALMYPLLWDIIRWARRNGARYFDLGGVTAGHLASEDPLGGISDFKRHFTEHLVQVGAEWSFEPRRGRARAARALSATSSAMGRVIAIVSGALGHASDAAGDLPGALPNLT